MFNALLQRINSFVSCENYHEEQLAFLNQKVNDDIQKGSYEFDALDYAYFYIKRHYKYGNYIAV